MNPQEESALRKINEAARDAKGYPDLVERFIDIGVQSYTVEVSSEITFYRLASGVGVLKENKAPIREVASSFDKEKTVRAIRNTQQGKSDYPTFLNEIAAAGVRFYEATLVGSEKRVTYFGIGGHYAEAIPAL